jgi:hypothetical protein
MALQSFVTSGSIFPTTQLHIPKNWHRLFKRWNFTYFEESIPASCCESDESIPQNVYS